MRIPFLALNFVIQTYQNRLASRVTAIFASYIFQEVWRRGKVIVGVHDVEVAGRKTHWRSSSLVIFEMSKSVKKLVEEANEKGYTDIDVCDRGLSNIKDIPGLSKFGSVSWI